MPIKKFFSKISITELIFFSLIFLFSWILMWKTFYLDSGDNLKIATKVWSDFAATLPLIRSFSLGSNFPPEYPLFAGPPIRYHFIFYLMVGLLERIGIPIDWALNLPSILGFFLLAIVIYFLGKVVFKSRAVGVLSVILFLFNGSLGFAEFFAKHPVSINTPTDIIHNASFSSFGPYDGKVVSAFWSLNIFTNQRHLAAAYAFFVLLIIYFYSYSKSPPKNISKHTLILGVLVGLMPFFHLAVFAMVYVLLITFFLVYPKLRRMIFIITLISLVISIPQFVYLGKSQVEANFVNPGYLIQNLTPISFLNYWIRNLGLTLVLFPLGFLATKGSRKKILLPFLAIFAIGNIFQFSPEIAANHKFFNLAVIGMNFYTASFLVFLFKRGALGKIALAIFLPILTLTGIVDFFPIINDNYVTLHDIKNNSAAAFIKESTPRRSVFLNASFLYDPASLAGRKIFLGWPYFPWSAGYDTDKRGKEMKAILESREKTPACQKLRDGKVDFVEIQTPTNLENIKINYSFWETNFTKIFNDKVQNIKIYSVSESCQS